MYKTVITCLLLISFGFGFGFGLIIDSHAELNEMSSAKHLFSISPNPLKINQMPVVINQNGYLQNEDTISYDGTNTNGLGLSNGGTLYGAVRFTPTISCSLKAIIFYQYHPVAENGWVYIHDAGTTTAPGEIIDSAPYTNNPATWIRVNFSTPRAYTAGSDFWLSVKVTHIGGQYPLGVDGGPSVSPARSFASDDQITWDPLPNIGINRNFNIRAVVKFVPYTNDVGIEQILSPGSSFRINILMSPKVKVKNYGTQTQTNFSVICSIVGAGGELRYTDVQNIGLLTAGDTTTISFTPWTPSIIEICTVKMRTVLDNDENLLNNTKTRITIITDLFLIEGFNDPTFPPAGWQSVIVSGTYNWERFPSGINPSCNPYEGPAMAAYRSYSAPPGSQARLITPAINVGPILSACSLNFMMYHSTGYPTVAESIKIEVSTDGVSFTRVAAFRRYAITSGWQEHSVYLGAYTNIIYVGFLAYAGYGNNMYIDYVRIFGRQLPPNDVGVHEIISPGSWHQFNTIMTPIGRVKNYGSATQSNFTVICTILGTGNVVRYTDVKTVAALAPGDTTTVNFTSWTPSIMERCSVRIRTMLSGDQNPSNDLKTIITDINFLTEKFTNELFPPLGWTVYNFDGGTQTWERYTSGPYTVPACASCRYESSTLLNNDWLITPRIGPLRVNDSLIFYYRNYSSTFTDTMFIRVSTNPAVNDTTSYNIIDIIATNANSWTQKAISLSQFAGNQIYIAFNYRCLYKFRIAIDNIEIRSYQAGISENRADEFTHIPILIGPNPNLISNGSVSISFTLSEPAKVNVTIWDATGRLIKTLAYNSLSPGVYKYTWDCIDEQNKRVSPGVYFYRIQISNDQITEKILIVR